MSLPDYAELLCCSNFSFLRGASHPEELVVQAAAQGVAAWRRLQAAGAASKGPR